MTVQLEDLKLLIEDYEYLKADNAWLRKEMNKREELTKLYMDTKYEDVEEKYINDKAFRKAINQYVKQWIIDNSCTCEADEWDTFYWNGRAYDLNIFVSDDVYEPSVEDVQAVVYAVGFDGVSLNCDTSNGCVMVDFRPTAKELDNNNYGAQ
jgi:DNA mismatch repair ATPase MutL